MYSAVYFIIFTSELVEQVAIAIFLIIVLFEGYFEWPILVSRESLTVIGAVELADWC